MISAAVFQETVLGATHPKPAELVIVTLSGTDGKSGAT
jgi:hypothetical protein